MNPVHGWRCAMSSSPSASRRSLPRCSSPWPCPSTNSPSPGSSPGSNETLPVKVLGFLQGQVSPRINVIGTFVFIASMTLVVLAQILLMKRSSAPKAAAENTRVQ